MAITILAQQSAIQSTGRFPLPVRVENALTSTIRYAADSFWPAALFNPHAYNFGITAWEAVAAALAVGAVSILAIGQRGHHPWLAVGWFWFLITLGPVIGLVQVGEQARADRYMYVPIVGLALIAAWAGAAIIERLPKLRPVGWTAGIAACLMLAVRTFGQTSYWTDSETLFRHALAVDKGNYLAWRYLGNAVANDAGRTFEALASFRQGLQIRPQDPGLHTALARVLFDNGRYEDSIVEYRESVRLNPLPGEQVKLGEALQHAGDASEALKIFETVVRDFPNFAPALNDLGTLLWQQPDRRAEGLRHLRRAVEQSPDFAMAQSNLAQALMNDPGTAEEALLHFAHALKVDPDLATAHFGVGIILLRAGMRQEAIAQLETAQRLEPKPEVAALLNQLR
jgi:tetratricopeptide (TPR) repeat protein